MSDTPLFQNTDEQEKAFAPQQVPSEQARVRADGGSDTNTYMDNEPPAAAPVANIGNSPTGSAAPPNIGRAQGGAAFDEQVAQAEYPIGDGDRS